MTPGSRSRRAPKLRYVPSDPEPRIELGPTVYETVAPPVELLRNEQATEESNSA